MKLVVTAGYGRSLHAIALVESLARRGHTVTLCLEVATLNPRRARAYLRQLGARRLLAKVRARFVPSSGGSAGDEVAPMRRWVESQGVRSRTVADASRAVSAAHRRVTSLNASDAIEALREARPDLVVYAGGGIVGRDFLAASGQGVLNVHGGPLPAFRGMNAAEWAVLHGVQPECVAHWMEPTVDTGPVLGATVVSLDGVTSVPAMRGVMTRASVELMLATVDAIAAGQATGRPQRREDGRLFHVMASPLLDMVERRLAQRAPLAPAGTFRFAAAQPAVPA